MPELDLEDMTDEELAQLYPEYKRPKKQEEHICKIFGPLKLG